MFAVQIAGSFGSHLVYLTIMRSGGVRKEGDCVMMELMCHWLFFYMHSTAIFKMLKVLSAPENVDTRQTSYRVVFFHVKYLLDVGYIQSLIN